MSIPKYIKPSMTVEAAARQAHQRGAYLKSFWDPTMGLRVIEVKRETDEQKQRT